MDEPQPDTAPEPRAEQTVPSRSPLKTLRAVVLFLAFAVVVSGIIGIMATSPWTRSTPDCSVYCVIENKLKSFFGSSG